NLAAVSLPIAPEPPVTTSTLSCIRFIWIPPLLPDIRLKEANGGEPPVPNRHRWNAASAAVWRLLHRCDQASFRVDHDADAPSLVVEARAKQALVGAGAPFTQLGDPAVVH